MDSKTYFEVMEFYAHQMRALDALDVDRYLDTFTEDGVTVHTHRDQELRGRKEMEEHARSALPRYHGSVVRHWNDHYLITQDAPDTYTVTYCSLVSRTSASGEVSFEPTFYVTDLLVHEDGHLLTKKRHIAADLPEPTLHEAAR